MTRIGALLAGIVLLAGCADVETKPSPDAADPQRAFARLKLLAGRWTVPLAAAPEVATEKHVSNGDAKPEATADVKPDAAPEAKPEAKPATLNVEYAVTSGGHTLQEKLFAGTSEEMVSMYFLEGEGLALIHYQGRPPLRVGRDGDRRRPEGRRPHPPRADPLRRRRHDRVRVVPLEGRQGGGPERLHAEPRGRLHATGEVTPRAAARRLSRSSLPDTFRAQ